MLTVANELGLNKLKREMDSMLAWQVKLAPYSLFEMWRLSQENSARKLEEACLSHFLNTVESFTADEQGKEEFAALFGMMRPSIRRLVSASLYKASFAAHEQEGDLQVP